MVVLNLLRVFYFQSTLTYQVVVVVVDFLKKIFNFFLVLGDKQMERNALHKR
jgi:hypothetical protein